MWRSTAWPIASVSSQRKSVAAQDPQVGAQLALVVEDRRVAAAARARAPRRRCETCPCRKSAASPPRTTNLAPLGAVEQAGRPDSSYSLVAITVRSYSRGLHLQLPVIPRSAHALNCSLLAAEEDLLVRPVKFGHIPHEIGRSQELTRGRRVRVAAPDDLHVLLRHRPPIGGYVQVAGGFRHV